MQSRSGKIFFLILVLFFTACENPQFSFNQSKLDIIIDKYVQNNSHPFIHVRFEDKLGNVIYEHNSINRKFLPKENILLAGQGRNNLRGAEQMAEKLKVSNLHIINSNGYHLDTSISPIFNNKYDCIGIICAREVFSYKEIHDLRNICKSNQWELIEIEHQDIDSSLSFRTAMNGLTLPGLFIGSKELNQKQISDFALSNNIIFDSANVSQFNLSGGSVHCLTNELF